MCNALLPSVACTSEKIKEIMITTTDKLAGGTSLQSILSADPQHLHIHIVDMPYRLTSTWQDRGCELRIWKKGDEIVAWAVFQPPWWNLDYAIQPSERGSSLEKELVEWGKKQMLQYANRIGEDFHGSVEIFEDTPNVDRTIEHLASLGFEKFDWSIIRFQKDLQQELPLPQLPGGFSIRSLRGEAEVESYVKLHRAAFGSDQMTTAWRIRTLKHPAYRPTLDLVAVNVEDKPVGFCIGWMWKGFGQIEPLGVHPDYQGSGLGRALELSALQALRNQGAGYTYIDHVSTNETAIALSLQTGFKQLNKAVRYFVRTSVGDK